MSSFLKKLLLIFIISSQWSLVSASKEGIKPAHQNQRPDQKDFKIARLVASGSLCPPDEPDDLEISPELDSLLNSLTVPHPELACPPSEGDLTPPSQERPPKTHALSSILDAKELLIITDGLRSFSIDSYDSLSLFLCLEKLPQESQSTDPTASEISEILLNHTLGETIPPSLRINSERYDWIQELILNSK
jgi:hypothetical protein